jgi:hypothetical protein
MEKDKIQKLNHAGWKTGSVREFLDLTEEESVFVDQKRKKTDPGTSGNLIEYKSIKDFKNGIR